MPDREKVFKALECLKEGSYCECCDYKPYDDCIKRVATEALALLNEQEEDYKNILSDYEDLAREHDKLLNKKIPLITNGLEVVYCKDCRHILPKGFCHKHSKKVADDYFCADGERRTSDA